ncbi:MAG: hypothetical protein WDO73_36945 [Ignavibacteriota bacterium]
MALIRHPVDQWSSLCKHKILRPVLTPSGFCEAYAAFLEELGSTTAHKYEDFVDRPEAELRAICGDLALPFDLSFAKRFQAFDYVTGDFRRQQEQSISPPGRRKLSPRILDEFQSSAAFGRILSVTGYTEPHTPGTVTSLVAGHRRSSSKVVTIKRLDKCLKFWDA